MAETIEGLDTYITWLKKLHSKHVAFERKIVDSIEESDATGTNVVVYTNNTKTAPDGKVTTFNDFSKIHFNKDGLIDKLHQGPGVFSALSS